MVSDSHDRGPQLAATVREAIALGASAVVHCGDVIGAGTLKATIALGMPIHAVHGNNLGDPVAFARLARNAEGVLDYHGGDADLRLGGRRVFVTHYPHLGRGMASTGDYDLVCCGHSHQAKLEQVPNARGGQSWLINPGTVAGLGAPATWILADLAAMTFEIRAAS